jgi:hypothetical protein
MSIRGELREPPLRILMHGILAPLKTNLMIISDTNSDLKQPMLFRSM